MENTDLVKLILKFIADVVQNAVWPVTILVMLSIFRQPIVRLLDRLKKGSIKAGNKEFFFEADTSGEVRKELSKSDAGHKLASE